MPEHIRDANRIRPGEPGYNPQTLHIPSGWFAKWKVRPRQRAGCINTPWRFRSRDEPPAAQELAP